MATADASDLRDDFKQTHNGSMFSANGLTVTMRIFATAQECCAALISGGWTICIASSEPSQAGFLLQNKKLAIIAAEPFPSKAFVQAALHETPGKAIQLGLSVHRNSHRLDHALSPCLFNDSLCTLKRTWFTSILVFHRPEHGLSPCL